MRSYRCLWKSETLTNITFNVLKHVFRIPDQLGIQVSATSTLQTRCADVAAESLYATKAISAVKVSWSIGTNSFNKKGISLLHIYAHRHKNWSFSSLNVFVGQPFLVIIYEHSFLL